MHALLHAPTDLFVSVAQRLFSGAAGATRGDSSEGTQQGFAISSGGFSVAIHPELRALDEELAPFGGAARAIMDDAYAIGPPEVVFPALERFAAALRTATALEVQQAKYACWSPEYDLERCPWRRRVGAGIGGEDIGDPSSPRHGERAIGIMIGGVPVGEDDFVYEVMRRKADEIVSYVDHTLSSLRDRPHSAWASLYYSCASRLDHWLRHLPPYLVRPAARRVDHRLRLAADQLGYEGMLDDDFARERFGMPARMHGCGIRSRFEVAPAAFVACCVESMELALDEQRPLFAALRPLFGAGAFAVGGHRFARFLASSSDTALEFEVAWDALREEVQAAQRPHIGPLDLPAQDAGRARGEDRLQRAITLQVEEVRRDALHVRVSALPVTDPRREAWMAAGRGSRQWVTSYPTERMDLEGHGGYDFRITIATYLGRECPVARGLARDGVVLAGPRGGADIPVDAHGFVLSRATHLPGGSHTAVHDVTADEFFSICEEAGLELRREPRDIFARALPPAALVAAPGQGRPAIIPDASVRASLPPALTSSTDRPSRHRLPMRRLLLDWKTVHAGTTRYQSARARDRQSGAVEERAQQVHPEYLRHARQLDQRYHPQASPPVTITPGPVEQVVLDHDRVRGVVIGGYGEWSMDVEWLLEEAARTAARRDWSRMGLPGEQVAYALIVASYRRRMGVIAVREMARHRYRQSQFAGLTRLQLDEVGRERQVQQQGRQRAEALAERSVEIAQAMVPLAGALARGGG